MTDRKNLIVRLDLGEIEAIRAAPGAIRVVITNAQDVCCVHSAVICDAAIALGGTQDGQRNLLRAATAALPDNVIYDRFQGAFIDRFGVDPVNGSFTANAYDAAWLMALGSVWATYHGDGLLGADGKHEVTGVNIARGLRKTAGADSTTAIRFIRTEWPSAVSQFMAGREIDVTGVAGDHDWDLSSEEAPGPTTLFQRDADGNFKPAE